MEDQKREFTGVWIPKEVYLDENLTPTEKMLYAEINCFDVCFKNNKSFAKHLNVGETYISKMLNNLKERGYIVEIGFDGRKKSWQTYERVQGRVGKKCKAGLEKSATIDNNIDNKIDTPYSPPDGKREIPITETSFDVFWQAYPRKTAKGAARKAFDKAIKKTDLETILKALKLTQWNDEQKYIRHASTWLNENGWEDIEEGDGIEAIARKVIAAHKKGEEYIPFNAEGEFAHQLCLAGIISHEEAYWKLDENDNDISFRNTHPIYKKYKHLFYE